MHDNDKRGSSSRGCASCFSGQKCQVEESEVKEEANFCFVVRKGKILKGIDLYRTRYKMKITDKLGDAIKYRSTLQKVSCEYDACAA